MRINERFINLLLVAVLFYLFVLQVRAIWPFTIDDMYISLRYAKHWAAGQGLLWNIGEPPVEGYSNFSFVVLARIALFLGFDPVVVLKGAGSLGLFCTCVAVYAIARMWLLTRIALIPCFWLLAYKGQILWSVSGLETTVYQALICFSVFFIFKGLGYSSYPKINESPRPLSFIMAGFLLALASMTRPEGPALMILFVLILLYCSRSSSDGFVVGWTKKRERPAHLCALQGVAASSLVKEFSSASRRYTQRLILFCCTFLVFFAPYFFWRWHYYGRLFPNPVYCKGLTNFVSYTLDKNYLYLIWPFALIALPAVWQAKDNRHYFLWLPSVVYLILLMSADPIVAFDNRLFLPAFALLLPLTVVGMDRVFEMYSDKVGHFHSTIYLGAFLFTFFFIPMLSLAGYRHFVENPLAGERLRKHVIAWLEHHILPGSRVLLADSGLIPYKSSYQFIDSYCLNNAEMTKMSARSMYQQFSENVLATKPDVIILTALLEEGRVNYTPADACLALKLLHHKDYSRQTSFKTGSQYSFYRYEIFSRNASDRGN
jgi:hypothetical protein